MRHRQDILVKCPYYKGEERQRIICEGVLDGTSLQMVFVKGSVTDHKGHCCKRAWNKCPIAQMLNRKYDYEEDA